MLLYQTHRDSIEFLEKENLIVLKVWNYGMDEEIKCLMEFALKSLKTKECKEIIFDLSHWPGGFSEEMMEWFYTDYVPRCIYSDLETIAIVVPKDPFSLIVTNSLVEIISSMFKIKYFKNIDSAQTWLMNNRYFSQFPFSDN